MNELEEDTLPRRGSWWVRSLGSKSSKKQVRQYEKKGGPRAAAGRGDGDEDCREYVKISIILIKTRHHRQSQQCAWCVQVLMGWWHWDCHWGHRT